MDEEKEVTAAEAAAATQQPQVPAKQAGGGRRHLGERFHTAREQQLEEEKTAAKVATQARKGEAKAGGPWKRKQGPKKLGAW